MVYSDGLISSWYEAELLAANHMRALGFEDASTTQGGPDGGIDVSASGGVAQVKHYSSGPIGAPAVQRLVGAGLGRGAMVFYALTGYTPAAHAYAERASVSLFSYDPTCEVAAENDAAANLLERGHVAVSQLKASAARDEFVAHMRTYGQRVADAITTGIRLANRLTNEDVERVQQGVAPHWITPSNIASASHEILNLQSELRRLGDGVARSTGEWGELIVGLESLARKALERFEIDYDEIARASEILRSRGALGGRDEEAEDEVLAELDLYPR